MLLSALLPLRVTERVTDVAARYPTRAAIGQRHLNRRTRRLRVLLLAVGILVVLLLLLSRIALPPRPSIPAKNAHWALADTLMVAGQPRDIDLVNLRDTLAVGGAIDVRPDASPLDAVVARSFGIRYLGLPVPAGGVPSARQLAAASHFVGARVAARKAVLVYDEFGLNQAPATAALLLVLRGESAAAALKHGVPHSAKLTPQQLAVIRDVALLRVRGVTARPEIAAYRVAIRSRW